MNIARMKRALTTIEERQLALQWLNEYGVKLEAKPEQGDARVEVTLYFAASCTGSAQARKVIEAYARIRLPEAIQDAIKCCQNDIGIAMSDIREELGS